VYLTTFFVEPGYEEPVKNRNQMLVSERKFGFIEYNMIFSPKPPNLLTQKFSKNQCCVQASRTCFMWATLYHNISTIIDDVSVEYYRQIGYWADAYYTLLLCELKDDVVATYGYVFIVKNERCLLELINDVLVHVDKGNILMRIKKHIFQNSNCVYTSGFIK